MNGGKGKSNEALGRKISIDQVGITVWGESKKDYLER